MYAAVNRRRRYALQDVVDPGDRVRDRLDRDVRVDPGDVGFGQDRASERLLLQEGGDPGASRLEAREFRPQPADHAGLFGQVEALVQNLRGEPALEVIFRGWGRHLGGVGGLLDDIAHRLLGVGRRDVVSEDRIGGGALGGDVYDGPQRMRPRPQAVEVDGADGLTVDEEPVQRARRQRLRALGDDREQAEAFERSTQIAGRGGGGAMIPAVSRGMQAISNRAECISIARTARRIVERCAWAESSGREARWGVAGIWADLVREE